MGGVPLKSSLEHLAVTIELLLLVMNLRGARLYAGFEQITRKCEYCKINGLQVPTPLISLCRFLEPALRPESTVAQK
jgi:hypothetical protein